MFSFIILYCTPPKFICWILNAGLQNVTLFGDGVFKVIVKLKMRPPNPVSVVSHKKRRSGPRHTQRADHIRTQGEDSLLHTEEKGLKNSQPCPLFDLRLPEINVCCLSHPVYIVSCLGSLNGLRHPLPCIYFTIHKIHEWENEVTFHLSTPMSNFRASVINNLWKVIIM